MTDVNRRTFLASLPAAAGALAHVANGGAAPEAPMPAHGTGSAHGVAFPLRTFDYAGVSLRPSHWLEQYRTNREYYYNVPNEDILHGYRAAAGLPAPGRALGGWSRPTSGMVFGQWLSGMSMMYRATGDEAMRDKAFYLFTEWAGTLPTDGNMSSRHYIWDKLVCGLVDLARYGDHPETLDVLERGVRAARRTLSRENLPFDAKRHSQGYPTEWYTLSENLYRAYLLTGNPMYEEFAAVWHYPYYWGMFERTSAPTGAHGCHAYSHVNTLSSLCATYEVTGDPTLLTEAKNAYDYLQNTQCFSTGGYGPDERFMTPNGSLGRALDTRSDTTEIGCGSWAGFKLSRYLMCATGEARYGDWAERLVYNGVGMMLPLSGRGRNFYYADYRVGGGMRVYLYDTFTCCSGTLIQNLATYHDLIYLQDDHGLYVNLFLPSEVTWSGPAGEVKVVQDTRYPDEETTTLTLQLGAPAAFPLHFRVPGWTSGASVKVNGAAVDVPTRPGTWATVERTWSKGDRVEIHIPLTLRMEAVDRWHPDRVAVMRGPTTLVLEGGYHDPEFRLPEHDADLETWLVPEPWSEDIGSLMPVEDSSVPRPTIFRVAPPDGSKVILRFRPLWDVGKDYPYFAYFDRDRLPQSLW